MAKDETNETDETTTNEDGEGGKDYESLYAEALKQSRKWEERAKANKEKADKWDAASGGEESLEQRIAKLESDKRDLEQRQQRQSVVAKVAAKYGLTPDIVGALNGADEKALEEQAQAIAALKPKGAPSAPEAGKIPRGEGADTDERRTFVRQLFGKD